MEALTVTDAMSREVFAARPGTSLDAVARLFSSRYVSGIPVIDDDCKPVGVVSHTDIVDPDRLRGPTLGDACCYRIAGGACVAVDCGPVTRPGVVADVMMAFVVSVPGHTALREAVELMVADNIHRVVVVDDARRVTGILTSMDVMRALLGG
jgi:predicted transcriptional regulator